MGLLAMAKARAKDKSSTSTSTSTSTSSRDNNSGMGLLLVFFPQYNSTTTTTTIADKTNLNFPSPSSKSPTSTSTFKRTNSNSPLLSKAQSTISICALLLFITLLLFTLSTFEPNPTLPHTFPPRRFLLHNQKPPIPIPKPRTHPWLPILWPIKSHNTNNNASKAHYALQRMGTLHRRGTRAMTDLVVCHVAHETSDDEFRLFLRLIHRSGLTARADVVFVFASPSLSSRFAPIIRRENDAFFTLVELHAELNSTRWTQQPESSFELIRFFLKHGNGNKKGAEIGEPLWGKRIRSNCSNPEAELNGGGALLSYGSVLSFDETELDPENSLAGFLDRVPLSLRRWACYPMLLGRVRRNFKHVMLVDAKNVLIVNDPLGRVRNRSPESVFLFTKHYKKNSDKTQSTQRPVNSAVVMGGARGVRRLSNAMLIEIVRAAMQHKKTSVSESVILSKLVGNEFMLKNNNVNLITATESIPEASSLADHNSGASTSLSDYAIIQRGTNNHHDLDTVIKKQICSSVVDSSVYRDC